MWTKEQTCPGPNLCGASERCEAERKEIKTDEERLAWVYKWRAKNPNTDDDPFYICFDCGRYRRDQLVQCPECGKYFKGPRPNFPFDYECENCE